MTSTIASLSSGFYFSMFFTVRMPDQPQEPSLHSLLFLLICETRRYRSCFTREHTWSYFCIQIDNRLSCSNNFFIGRDSIFTTRYLYQDSFQPVSYYWSIFQSFSTGLCLTVEGRFAVAIVSASIFFLRLCSCIIHSPLVSCSFFSRPITGSLTSSSFLLLIVVSESPLPDTLTFLPTFRAQTST
jgi:hypothetical protein